jgi:hypothetical protein
MKIISKILIYLFLEAGFGGFCWAFSWIVFLSLFLDLESASAVVCGSEVENPQSSITAFARAITSVCTQIQQHGGIDIQDHPTSTLTLAVRPSK